MGVLPKEIKNLSTSVKLVCYKPSTQTADWQTPPNLQAPSRATTGIYIHLIKTTLDDIGMILVPSSVPILANFLLEAKTRLIFLFFSGCEIARISRISSVKVGFRFLINRHWLCGSRSPLWTRPDQIWWPNPQRDPEALGVPCHNLRFIQYEYCWKLCVRLIPLYVGDGTPHMSITSIKTIAICNLQSGYLRMSLKVSMVKNYFIHMFFFND